jgi:hypothetical protein
MSKKWNLAHQNKNVLVMSDEHSYCRREIQKIGKIFETLLDERQALLPPGPNQSGRLDRQCSGPMGDDNP